MLSPSGRPHRGSASWRSVDVAPCSVVVTTAVLLTVGVNKNWTLVFVNFSAQVASILKISAPIIKMRS